MHRGVIYRLLIIVVCNYLIEHFSLLLSINTLVILKDSYPYWKIISIPHTNMYVTLEYCNTHLLIIVSNKHLLKITLFLTPILNSHSTIKHSLSYLWIVWLLLSNYHDLRLNYILLVMSTPPINKKGGS